MVEAPVAGVPGPGESAPADPGTANVSAAMRVAVISGGRSSEHEISLRSGASVVTGLLAAGHEVTAIRIERAGEWLLDGEPVSIRPADGLYVGPERLPLDAAFPVLHGPFGEDGVTQGALETAGIPYVGSDVLGSAVAMDKLTLKKVCGFHRVPQVEFVEVGTPGWERAASELGFPLWVKPSRLGSSVGITRVETAGELPAAVKDAAGHDPRVIIEAHCDGREVECSVLGNDEVEASLPGEILADAEWYDFEAKYTEGRMRLAVPADLDQATTERVRRLATEVFRLAGGSGLARCDFFVEADGTVLLNEINTIPGFTETSVYSKLWEATGLPYPDLCDRLVRLAIERHHADADHSF